jgi:hypothetical protein
MEIRIHSESNSVATFFQDNPAVVSAIVKNIQSTKIFSGNILTIAGEYSLTSFATARVTRIDLVAQDLPLWKQPEDILDVVELSEEEFRKRSHLDEPSRLERRRTPKQTGQFALVFVALEMTGGTQIFLAAKIRVGLPAERLQRLRTLFSSTAVHFRARGGGTAFVNLKNLVRFTLNPGPDVTPSDAWPAHHAVNGEESQRRAYSLS